MNSENSKTSGPYRLLFNCTDKTDVTRNDKYIALLNLSMYYNGKINNKYINNKFNISALAWNHGL